MDFTESMFQYTVSAVSLEAATLVTAAVSQDCATHGRSCGKKGLHAERNFREKDLPRCRPFHDKELHGRPFRNNEPRRPLSYQRDHTTRKLA